MLYSTNWVISNALALNLKKQSTCYSVGKILNLQTNLNAQIKKIDRVKEVRFLGVIVDEKLNWSIHIKTSKSKTSRYISILCKIKKLLPIEAKIPIRTQPELNFAPVPEPPVKSGTGTGLFYRYRDQYQALSPVRNRYQAVTGTETVTMLCHRNWY